MSTLDSALAAEKYNDTIESERNSGTDSELDLVSWFVVMQSCKRSRRLPKKGEWGCQTLSILPKPSVIL